MNKFSMTCSCGDVMSVEAVSREEGVSKLKAMMTPEMISEHYASKHPGQAVPPVTDVHAMIDQNVQPA